MSYTEARIELDGARAAGDRGREAEAWRRLGRIQVELEDYSDAVDSFEQAVRTRRGLGEPAALAVALQEAASANRHTGDHGPALALLEEALELRRTLGDAAVLADVRNDYCLILQKLGRFREAGACYETTLELARSSDDRDLEGLVLNNLGGVFANLGEPQKHFEYLHAALKLRRSRGDEFGVAATLNNLGSLHRSLGEVDEAVLHLTEALAIFERLDNRYWLARTLNNLGYAYLEVGEPERARAHLLRSIPIRREVGDRAGEAVTLRNLGRTFQALGDEGKALAFYQKALEIAESRDDRRGVVTARKLLGGFLASSRPGEARAALEPALAEARAMGHRHEQAEILVLLARAQLASEPKTTGSVESASERATESLDLYRAVRDPLGEATAGTLLARIARRRDEPAVAQRHLDAALAALGKVDRRLGEASRRASFLASQRAVYELYVDVLIERHRKDPDEGHDRRALEVSERARSRALLALLDSSKADDDALRDAERRLAVKIQRQIDLLGSEHGAAEAHRAEEERLEALTDVESERARLRRTAPRHPSFAALPELDAAGVQRLVDRNTAIVEILLGDEGSHGWWIDDHAIVHFALPPRSEIESLARAAHESLSSPGGSAGREGREALVSLGSTLFGPVADRLADRRLALVADGALHLVPPAALGDPRSQSRSDPGVYRPLLLRHEIVTLPSATVLAEQRTSAKTPRNPTAESGPILAVLADPIFRADDARLDPEPLAVRGSFGDLARLTHSRREAEVIATQVEGASRLLALGAEANRSLVVRGALRDYRILHFATHGIVHPSAPELSGLVLSRFDAAGRAVDGFLGLHDVARLDLAADLVVLSGCHTALGKEVRGEGLVGLARGFMYAGAPRVVAGHWQVRDQATAELMSRFYAAYLGEGRPAAAALRNAQLELRELRRFRDPYSWAAISLQGDWR